MHGVLEANAAVAVSRIAEISEHEERDLFVTPQVVNDLVAEGVQSTLQDRSDDRGYRGHLVGDGTELRLLSNAHGRNVSQGRGCRMSAHTDVFWSVVSPCMGGPRQTADGRRHGAPIGIDDVSRSNAGNRPSQRLEHHRDLGKPGDARPPAP
jgi:hypothetical protein